MYKLTRQSDKCIWIKRKFSNIEYGEKNILHTYPPKVGCGVFLYNSMSDYWQTTVIEMVEKQIDGSYIFKTKNTNYKIEICDDVDETVQVIQSMFDRRNNLNK